MCVLSDQTIREFVNRESMVDPFHESNLRGASYDFVVGEEYYLFEKKHKGKVVVNTLQQGESFSIPPQGVCYVLTEEKVKLPRNVAATISLRLGLIWQGVMLANQPPIDPGYEGKIVAMLYNLADKNVVLRRGDRLLTMEFRFLDREASLPYEGRYKELEHLQNFIRKPIIGAIRIINERITRWEARTSKSIPTILAIIAVIIAILTIFLAGIGFKNVFFPPRQKVSIEQQEAQCSGNYRALDINVSDSLKTTQDIETLKREER